MKVVAITKYGKQEEVFPEEVFKAPEYAESGKNSGKIILSITE